MTVPLLDQKQTDQALRDLMPIVECLTNSAAAKHDGVQGMANGWLLRAVEAHRDVPYNSPAVKAYLRWLEQNTKANEPSKWAGSDPGVPGGVFEAASELYLALHGIMQVIEIDQLIPESVSYMKQARAALAKARGE